MDAVERVKSICKERGIPISRLERQLGFSNGYINRLKEGKFPTDRAQAIADYLGVSLNYIVKGTEATGYYLDPATASIAQEIFDRPDLRALFDASRDAKPEDLKLAADLLLRLKATNPEG